ncbi:hypothetical protein [Lysinibacillus xylanilyticus]|uniref:hypothetical protein n=1 Tax=Lysinibacillus xylanilyticus TaxID=582475 RepID=UPI003D044B3D
MKKHNKIHNQLCNLGKLNLGELKGYVVTESLNLESVADIPIFNRIRELNKQEMMAIYQFLEGNK